MKNKVTIENVRVGMRVYSIEDSRILYGYVMECEDFHNVFVKFDNNFGSAYYCLVENCEDNGGEIDILYYDL